MILLVDDFDMVLMDLETLPTLDIDDEVLVTSM